MSHDDEAAFLRERLREAQARAKALEVELLELRRRYEADVCHYQGRARLAETRLAEIELERKEHA